MASNNPLIPKHALEEHILVLENQLSTTPNHPMFESKRKDLQEQISQLRSSVGSSGATEMMVSGARADEGLSSWPYMYSENDTVRSAVGGKRRRADTMDYGNGGAQQGPETKSQRTTPSPGLSTQTFDGGSSPSFPTETSDESFARRLQEEENVTANAYTNNSIFFPDSAGSSSRVRSSSALASGSGDHRASSENNHTLLSDEEYARQLQERYNDGSFSSDFEEDYAKSQQSNQYSLPQDSHNGYHQQFDPVPKQTPDTTQPTDTFEIETVDLTRDDGNDDGGFDCSFDAYLSRFAPSTPNAQLPAASYNSDREFKHDPLGFIPQWAPDSLLGDESDSFDNGTLEAALNEAERQEGKLCASGVIDSMTPPNPYGQIVDSNGNVLNNGWPGYSNEINRYINHVRYDPTKTSDEIKDLLGNIRPDMEIPPENREGTPEEMVYPLMEHQKLGLAWLKAMEKGSNRGGILADDMGLGKTIQTIALMVTHRSEDPKRKTNLIVAPVALLKQWERELQKKLKPNHQLSVCIYHGTKKPRSFKELAKYDVVLTTFGTIASEYKRKTQSLARGDGNYNSIFMGASSKWYRTIIDEAQFIKNKETQSAKGCCELDSQYRICLSGTPMQNNCDELFSLIRFLRIKPYNEWSQWLKTFSNPLKGRYGSDVQTAIRKLQALLKAILLRRTKESKIDDKPILTLPAKTVDMVHAAFSEDEQSFYSALETKSKIQFNKYLRASAVGRNYSNILVMLLRLRQACCHPHLINDIEMAAVEELDDNKLLQLARELPPDAVQRIKDAEVALECPICMDVTENPSIVTPCGHEFCFECLVRVHTQHDQSNLARGEDNATPKCPGCRGELDLKKVIDRISFKKVHQPELVPDKPKDLLDGLIYDTDSDEDSSDAESDDGSDLVDFIVQDDNSEAEKKKSSANKKKSRKGKEKAEPKNTRPRTLAEVRKDAMRNAKSKRQYMKYLRNRWVSSAKVDKCVEILEGIRTGDGKEKTIIFSQFTSLLDLVEVPIHHNGWKYKRYDGGMSSAHRNQALLDFCDDPEITIILVSLKAGNSGLNLVAASQIIILDPFYNPFIERQAIDRAHRIGQQKPVFVHRLIVPGTIEDRVLALQEEKKELIDGALDENASSGIGRLSLQDLGFLFGIGGGSRD